MKNGKNSALLASLKLKTTKARLGVLNIFDKAKKPLDVEAIIIKLKKIDITVDQATIYRILDIFTHKKIIKKLEFKEGKFRYEIASANHHHIICENCGVIEDVVDCPLDIIERDIAEKHHFLVKGHALEFFGLCTNCK